HVERMHAAHPAERVLGDAGVERVGRKIVAPAQELEALGRHDEMQNALLGADRAVAHRDTVEIGGDAEAHATAVTPALHRLHWITLPPPGRTGRTAPGRARARPARDDGTRAR